MRGALNLHGHVCDVDLDSRRCALRLLRDRGLVGYTSHMSGSDNGYHLEVPQQSLELDGEAQHHRAACAWAPLSGGTNLCRIRPQLKVNKKVRTLFVTILLMPSHSKTFMSFKCFIIVCLSLSLSPSP